MLVCNRHSTFGNSGSAICYSKEVIFANAFSIIEHGTILINPQHIAHYYPELPQEVFIFIPAVLKKNRISDFQMIVSVSFCVSLLF